MSHLKERSEKNCLNCNAVVTGRYCHVCGQENLHPEESTWHLITHFFNDITHFDGKFFSTLKYLLFRPGFLSREYKDGRRASYLNPVRMYIFTSAIFFLIFFSMTHIAEQDFSKKKFNNVLISEIEKMDSTKFSNFTKEANHGKPLTREEFKIFVDSIFNTHGIHLSTEKYKTRKEYDSLRKKGEIKDGWFNRILAYKEIEMREKYHGDQAEISKVFLNNLVHSYPQMLFISLPLFALVLKLLYIRRKEFYYVSHAIFSIQFYIFVFIISFFILMLQQLNGYVHSGWVTFPTVLLFLLIFFYLYKAMRNFYLQRRGKTILKFILLNISLIFITSLLFAIFTFFSLMKI